MASAKERKRSELGEWLDSVNFNKENLLEDNPEKIKKYLPYIMNRCLAGHLDTVLFANEMNKNHFLDKDMQYHFFLYTLRKRKRFSPWLKKEQIENLDIVKKHYGYSNEKARIAVDLLTKPQLEYLRNKHEEGGML